MITITYQCSVHEFASTLHDYCPFCEVIRLRKENETLLDCLNGSSKATYTAEMYDAQVERAEAAEAERDRYKQALIFMTGSLFDVITNNFATDFLAREALKGEPQ
jgi:hypothetical protein